MAEMLPCTNKYIRDRPELMGRMFESIYSHDINYLWQEAGGQVMPASHVGKQDLIQVQNQDVGAKEEKKVNRKPKNTRKKQQRDSKKYGSIEPFYSCGSF